MHWIGEAGSADSDKFAGMSDDTATLNESPNGCGSLRWGGNKTGKGSSNFMESSLAITRNANAIVLGCLSMSLVVCGFVTENLYYGNL